MTPNRHNYPDPPSLSEFGPFRTHDGFVCLADTKQSLVDQTPLFFTPVEWTAFEHAIREGRI